MDGRNSAAVGRCFIHLYSAIIPLFTVFHTYQLFTKCFTFTNMCNPIIYISYQLVQDFVHPQYVHPDPARLKRCRTQPDREGRCHNISDENIYIYVYIYIRIYLLMLVNNNKPPPISPQYLGGINHSQMGSLLLFYHHCIPLYTTKSNKLHQLPQWYDQETLWQSTGIFLYLALSMGYSLNHRK